jgi:coenzyme F420-reducing hydrogenase delta subunit
MPCTGKVEILHLLRAVEEGADGVMVVGCLEGECHYLEGNIRTKRRVAFAGQMLQEIGFEGKRVQMYTIDVSKPDQLVEIMQDMLKIVNELGPSPFNKTEGSPSQEENAHEI